MDKHGVEIERKYIIMKPSVSEMALLEGYTASEIEQIYLTSETGVTRRIRKRVTGGIPRFYLTEKRRIDSMSAIEAELKEGTRPIYKTRYTFLYRSQLFEVDVYPEWRSTAIMETELESRATAVDMPPFIRIVREVTGVRGYSNADMSRAFPPEEQS